MIDSGRYAPGPLRLLLLAAVLLAAAACSKGEAVKQNVWIERWAVQRPMTVKRAGPGVVAIGRRIYAIGGGEYSSKGLEIFSSVEYADVGDDGSLGEWKPGPRLRLPRIYVAAVVYGDFVYVMGGESMEGVYRGRSVQKAPELLDSVERARINPDGSLGEWVLEKERMNFPRRGAELFAHDGWLYASGGFSGDFLNDVEKARINPDGSLGEWTEASYTNRERYISGFAQKGSTFYVLGGHVNSPQRAMESVEMFRAEKGTTETEWKETSPLYTRRFLNAAVVVGNTIYALAGHNTINLSSTGHAQIQEDGELGAWEPDTPLNVARRAVGAVVVGERIYVIGGMVKPMGRSESVDVVESASMAQGRRLGHWAEAGGPEAAAYEEWKRAVPADAAEHIRHAKEYLGRRRFETALYDVSEALKEYPDYYEAYNTRADAYFRTGKREMAMEALRKSVGIKDNYAALSGLGYLSFENGDFTAAVDYYKRAAAVNPGSVDAHMDLGNAYMSAGDHVSAAREFEEVLKLEPGSTDAKHLLGLARKSTGAKSEEKDAGE